MVRLSGKVEAMAVTTRMARAIGLLDHVKQIFSWAGGLLANAHAFHILEGLLCALDFHGGGGGRHQDLEHIWWVLMPSFGERSHASLEC